MPRFFAALAVLAVCLTASPVHARQYCFPTTVPPAQAVINLQNRGYEASLIEGDEAQATVELFNAAPPKTSWKADAVIILSEYRVSDRYTLLFYQGAMFCGVGTMARHHEPEERDGA